MSETLRGDRQEKLNGGGEETETEQLLTDRPTAKRVLSGAGTRDSDRKNNMERVAETDEQENNKDAKRRGAEKPNMRGETGETF